MRYQCESKSWNSRDLIRKGKSASWLSETRNLPLCVETKQSKNTFWKSEDLLQLPDGGNMAITLLWAAESLSRGEGSTDPDCNVWWSVWRLFLFFFFPLSYFRYIPQKDPCSLLRTTAPEARTLMASPRAVLNLALSCLFSGLRCILCHVHFTFSDTSCRFGGGWGLFLGFFPSLALQWVEGYLIPVRRNQIGNYRELVAVAGRVEQSCSWWLCPCNGIFSFPCSEVSCCASTRY